MQRSKWAHIFDEPMPDDSDATSPRPSAQSISSAPLHHFAHNHLNSEDMAVCSFYQRGTCRFGDRCRDEHPGSARDASRGSSGGFGGSNTNRFAAFSGGGDRYRPGQQSGGGFGGGRDSKTPRFHMDPDDIKADLTTQRPIYPLSCYGPGREAPRQLIEGPVELSQEELRLRYYTQRASGNEAAAQQEESSLSSQMQQQVDSILKDISGAIRYVEDGANIHPNRLDIAQGKAPVSAPSGLSSSNTSSKPPSNPLGGASQTQTPAFGQPSNSPFGQPRLTAFGQPGNPGQTTSAFGQPSNPGQTTSAFGQPSNPGQTTSAFGQPSNPGQTTSAFGQASALGGAGGFGKPSIPSSTAFGQPSGLGGGTGFGQPSALGAGSAFGKPSIPGSGAAFGKPAALGQQTAFGQPSASGTTSAFGKPSVPGAAPGFGQVNALGQNTAAFGKPGFGQTGFGQPSQPGASASSFGQQQQQNNQASPFGQQQQGSQPSFGQPQQQQPPTQVNAFGGSASSQTSAFGQTGFGKPSPAPFATSQAQQPPAQPTNPFAQKSQSPAAAPSPFGAQVQSPRPIGQPQQQSVSPFAQQAQPAAVPGGAKPVDPKDRYKEGKPEEYEGEQGKELEGIYRRVGQLGRFNDNEDIPLVPPKYEWLVPVPGLI